MLRELGTVRLRNELIVYGVSGDTSNIELSIPNTYHNIMAHIESNLNVIIPVVFLNCEIGDLYNSLTAR